MALLFVESFDWIGSAGRTEYKQKWTQYEYGQPADADFSASYARTSGKGMRMKDACIIRGFDCPGNALVFGCGIKRISGEPQISFYSSGLDGAPCVTFKADGSITIVSYGTPHGVKQSGGGWFPANQWRFFEIKMVMSNTVGSYEVRCDGATIASWTGLDNLYQDYAGSPITGVKLNCWGPEAHWDDIYILDTTGSAPCNDFLGDVRISGILPSTGNGTNTDFTCSSSTDHGALVDDVGPDDDSTYVYSNTVGHIDTWNYPALGFTGVVKAVAMNLHCKKTDAGPRAVAAVTRPASTNRIHGTDKYISTVYLNHQSFWEVNPEDSAAWEIADIDAAEFGVKLTV